MQLPLKVTASLKVKKALKWPWKVYLCDVNICSDPDFNSEKADFQAPLLWTYHRVPVIKTIHRGTFGSLHLPEKILTLLYFAESKGAMLKISKFGQISKNSKNIQNCFLYAFAATGNQTLGCRLEACYHWHYATMTWWRETNSKEFNTFNFVWQNLTATK